MKDESRRSILKKLGAGVGAIGALFLAPRSAVADPGGGCGLGPNLVNPVAPIIPQMPPEVEGVPEQIVRVHVDANTGYSAIVSAYDGGAGPIFNAATGWDPASQTLTLGLQNTGGAKLIYGLGYTPDPVFAAAGRCYIDTRKSDPDE